jgi:hypothetical protein
MPCGAGHRMSFGKLARPAEIHGLLRVRAPLLLDDGLFCDFQIPLTRAPDQLGECHIVLLQPCFDAFHELLGQADLNRNQFASLPEVIKWRFSISRQSDLLGAARRSTVVLTECIDHISCMQRSSIGTAVSYSVGRLGRMASTSASSGRTKRLSTKDIARL